MTFRTSFPSKVSRHEILREVPRRDRHLNELISISTAVGEDEQKRQHIRGRIKSYMDRAEEIKRLIQKQKDGQSSTFAYGALDIEKI